MILLLVPLSVTELSYIFSFKSEPIGCTGPPLSKDYRRGFVPTQFLEQAREVESANEFEWLLSSIGITLED